MPNELQPTSKEERGRWRDSHATSDGSLDKCGCRDCRHEKQILRLIADFDRLSGIIVAMHQNASGDNISGVLCEAQDYFETYGEAVNAQDNA